jgi:hypothetical protein
MATACKATAITVVILCFWFAGPRTNVMLLVVMSTSVLLTVSARVFVPRTYLDWIYLLVLALISWLGALGVARAVLNPVWIGNWLLVRSAGIILMSFIVGLHVTSGLAPGTARARRSILHLLK